MAPRSLFVADDRNQPRRYVQTGLAKSIAGLRKIGLNDDSIATLIQSLLQLGQAAEAVDR